MSTHTNTSTTPAQSNNQAEDCNSHSITEYTDADESMNTNTRREDTPHNPATNSDDAGCDDRVYESCPDEHIEDVGAAFAAEITDGEVSNVNVSSSIGRPIDIEEVGSDVDWGEVTETQHCHVSLPGVNADIRLYGDGKFTVTGATTADEIVTAVEELHWAVRELGVETEWCDVSIENIVVTFDEFVDGNLNLNAFGVQSGVVYDPDRFPGAVYRPEEDGRSETITAFRTSKVNVAGVSSLESANECREEVIEKFEEIGSDSVF